MSLVIRFSPESEETFEILIDQLSERWGDFFVMKLKAKVSKSLKAISRNPFLYALADEEREMSENAFYMRIAPCFTN